MKQAATWLKHIILQIPKLGYQSMYSYSLAATVYCTRQLAFLFKSIKKENEIRTVGGIA